MFFGQTYFLGPKYFLVMILVEKNGGKKIGIEFLDQVVILISNFVRLSVGLSSK